ncbi:hypothetical protein SK128_009772, partial [Halocaridina rubra]
NSGNTPCLRLRIVGLDRASRWECSGVTFVDELSEAIVNLVKIGSFSFVFRDLRRLAAVASVRSVRCWGVERTFSSPWDILAGGVRMIRLGGYYLGGGGWLGELEEKEEEGEKVSQSHFITLTVNISPK